MLSAPSKNTVISGHIAQEYFPWAEGEKMNVIQNFALRHLYDNSPRDQPHIFFPEAGKADWPLNVRVNSFCLFVLGENRSLIEESCLRSSPFQGFFPSHMR